MIEEQGDYAAAHALYADSLDVYRQLQDKTVMAGALGGQGYVALTQGDLAAANACVWKAWPWHVRRMIRHKLPWAAWISGWCESGRGTGQVHGCCWRRIYACTGTCKISGGFLDRWPDLPALKPLAVTASALSVCSAPP